MVLGHLWEDEEQSDFPWVVCTIQLFPAFENFAPIFAEQQRLMLSGEFAKADEQCRVIDEAGPAVVRSRDTSRQNIAMGLQIADGRAWFRLRRLSR
jgi:hypothetical protein